LQGIFYIFKVILFFNANYLSLLNQNIAL